MAKASYDARNQHFSIVDSDGSSTRDLSPYLTGIDGLPGTKELIDTSRIGDSGRTFTRSLWNGTAVLEYLYSNVTTSGISLVLDNLIDMSTATTFAYGPTGTSSGGTYINRKISGSCWVRSNTITGRVASAVSGRADIQIEGTVNFGTFT
jgi:hypothetical protein